MGRNASSSPGPDKERTVRCQNTVILQPRPRSEDNSTCDASQLGLGAWLRQIDKYGTERSVAMCSRSLVDAETRYLNIEKECLAVKFGLQKFEYYLQGRHKIIESDHSPIEQIFRKNIAETPSRLQKMILWCLGFDITVVYMPGTKYRQMHYPESVYQKVP